ncbi:putative nuclease HARBI1 [Temnothorax longispinosus]|uniref:putative nuclease HARBI1 n=1 Tax=Temnothorax longispinosus TaxID=300112 RepID=UPI003A99822A
MAGEFLGWDLIHLEHRVGRFERRIDRQNWRELHDPFDLHETEFIKLYRVTPEIVMEVTDALRERLEYRRVDALTPELQVLTALRFYAVGCYQGSIAEQWDIAISQPSVSRCLRRVTDAINAILLRRWVKFPMTDVDRHRAREKFADALQPFIGAIGAIDCTYINIKGPIVHEEAYVNHWGDHTLNVQVIGDPDLNILNVNARFPGARHDAYIWSNSPVRRVMQRKFDNGERNTWLIGDDGYTLEPWLMTPLKHEVPNTPRFRYNDDLCSARSCVERLFGVWKAVFRCLSAQRRLMYEPGVAGRIVNACAVLQNMRIAHRVQDVDFDDIDVENFHHNNRRNIAVEEDDRGQAYQGRALALRIQERFIARQYGIM